jgi:BMFP domain-containing protein YqiC
MTIPRPDAKMLDDLARVAGGAVNIFSGMQEQIRNDVRARMEEMATKLDLVPRDELDQAKGMIDKLRKDMKNLEDRIARLEGKKMTKAEKAHTPGKAKAKAPGRKPSPKQKKK